MKFVWLSVCLAFAIVRPSISGLFGTTRLVGCPASSDIIKEAGELLAIEDKYGRWGKLIKRLGASLIESTEFAQKIGNRMGWRKKRFLKSKNLLDRDIDSTFLFGLVYPSMDGNTKSQRFQKFFNEIAKCNLKPAEYKKRKKNLMNQWLAINKSHKGKSGAEIGQAIFDAIK